MLTSVEYPDSHEKLTPVKEVKDLRDSKEQLQITKGVNGTTSLQPVAESQDPKTLENQSLNAASFEGEPLTEPKKIFVNV